METIIPLGRMPTRRTRLEGLRYIINKSTTHFPWQDVHITLSFPHAWRPRCQVLGPD